MDICPRKTRSRRMASPNENSTDEVFKKILKERKWEISIAIKNPLPLLHDLRNKDIITKEEFEKYQNESSSSPGNIKKLVYDLPKKTNNISAVKEIFHRKNVKIYPNLTTIYQDMNNGKKILDVKCGKVKGVLDKEKMEKGTSEKCIKTSDGKWFTLLEFQKKGGRGSWKNWKMSINSNRVQLKKLIEKKILPKPPNNRKRERKTPSGSVHQLPQFQSTGDFGDEGPSGLRGAVALPVGQEQEELRVGSPPLEVELLEPKEEEQKEDVEIPLEEEEEEEEEQGPEPAPQRKGRKRTLLLQRSKCPVSLQRILGEKISKISSNCSNMLVKLEDTKKFFDSLQELLEEAPDMSDVQKQINDIIHYQTKLHSSLGKFLGTQSLEETML